MKRMRYYVGAAGLGPAAFALAMPGVATAAAAGHAQPVTSLRHAAGLARAASSVSSSPHTSSPAASSPMAKCVTSHYQTWPRNGNLRGHFWWAERSVLPYGTDYCVGTAVVSVYFTKNISKSVTVHFSGGLFQSPWRKTLTAKGTAGHWTKVNFGIHKWGYLHPHVAAYSEYSGGKHVSYTF